MINCVEIKILTILFCFCQFSRMLAELSVWLNSLAIYVGCLCHISFLLMTLNLPVCRYRTPYQFPEHHIPAFIFVVAEWTSQSSNHQILDSCSVLDSPSSAAAEALGKWLCSGVGWRHFSKSEFSPELISPHLVNAGGYLSFSWLKN